MKKSAIIIILVLCLFFCFSSYSYAKDENTKLPKMPVRILTIKGVINPVVSGYILRGIDKCEKVNAICIIKMDTPGGLMDPMWEIVKRMSSSSVPIVVYIWPEGGRAASAGVFITYASHLAAMAPATNIGAAHPVFSGSPVGQEDNKGTENIDVMMTKVTNDAVAHLRGMAEKRGRNIEWAEKAVRDAVSITNKEALELKVVEINAKDIDDLLKQMNGRKVMVLDKEVELMPDLTDVQEIPMTNAEKILYVISDPNIAFILMLLGIYGLIYELASPGVVLPGIVGGICIIVGLYSMGSLPINYAGLFLIIFSFILFIFEIKAPTHGILAAGGIISFVLGSLMLIPAGYPYFEISKTVIISSALFTAMFFMFAVSKVVKSRQRKVVTGYEGLVGLIGEAKTDLNPKGMVFVSGELWKANVKGDPIKTGDGIKVVKAEGLVLEVEAYKEV